MADVQGGAAPAEAAGATEQPQEAPEPLWEALLVLEGGIVWEAVVLDATETGPDPERWRAEAKERGGLVIEGGGMRGTKIIASRTTIPYEKIISISLVPEEEPAPAPAAQKTAASNVTPIKKGKGLGGFTG